MITRDDIKTFVLSAVRQRKILIANKGNRKDLSTIDKYRNILQAYAQDIPTTSRMARFYVAHYEKVVYLLPPNRHKKALEIYFECQIILKNA